jgi:dihydrofolate reductase
MAKLIYSALTSLDGYIADENGNFAWAMPDVEVHAAVNDLMRPVGTHLYGRRLYEVMVAWETLGTGDDDEEVEKDFAEMWRGADKVVYSNTLEAATTARTRIERQFDPDAVRALKQSADRDLLVGGAELAGQALRAGLVDEVSLFMSPVIVGGGTRALADGIRLDLQLHDQRRFGNGVVCVHYRVAS